MKCAKCSRTIPIESRFCLFCGAAVEGAEKYTPKHTRRGNGLGSVYKHGNTWAVEVTVGWSEGKRIRKRYYGYRTKKEALQALPEKLVSAKNDVKTTPTFADYYASWVKTDLEKLSKSKQTAYKIAWNKLSELHDVCVDKATVLMLRDVVGAVAPTFYPARDCKSLLSHLCKLAVVDGNMAGNMAQYITLPAMNETTRSAWTDEEIGKFWTAYENGDCFAPYILLMTYSGMMPGELRLVEKKMINFEEQTIVGAGLKTKVRKETPIALAEFIIPVLEHLCEASETEKICNLSKTDLYDEYEKFCERVKVEHKPLYTCRHTTATALAVGANIAPSIIQRVMRHSKFTTTQRYIHPDSTDAIAALDTLLPKRGI